MDDIKSFRKAYSNAIKHGETIYGLLAKGCGLDPEEALQWMPSMLTTPWVELNTSLLI